MSTPGAIAVYTQGSGAPAKVHGRPWRGVYHHWDGYPEGLGQHLVARVKARGGDLASVVRELIDAAPHGWSSCWGEGTEQLTDGLDVRPENTANVAYVYVFDLEARRLDAFETFSGAEGDRLGSVTFSPSGEPDLPALDLRPEERVTEAALSGPRLSPELLTQWVRALPPLETTLKLEQGTYRRVLSWSGAAETADGGLELTFRVVDWEGEGIANVVERGWPVVPPMARDEPQRVKHLLDALVLVVKRDPRALDAFWIAALDPLRRSGARERESLERVLLAHTRSLED